MTKTSRTLEIGLGGVGVLPDRMRKLRLEVVAALAESIAAIGQGEPIIVRPREGGGYWLVAGLHRLMACRKLKLPTIRAEVQDLDEETARLIEIDENLVRADLTPAERAEHIGRRKELYERLHPETKPGGDRKSTKARSKSQNGILKTFVDQTATVTGKGRATVARDATRAKTIVVLTDIVGTSLDRGDELDALAKLAPDEQRQLAARAQAGQRVSAKTRVKQLKRDARELQLSVKQSALPDKGYGVIVADPEWRFEPWSRKTGMDRAADNHYPTSALEVIKSRPVETIAAKDCVLFLWATQPMERHAHAVMEAWGFNYCSQVIWRKIRPGEGRGTGYWFINEHEILLVGVGEHSKIPAPAPGTQWPSVIEAPVGKHSEKPAIFMQMIEEYFPNPPKIELNCRGKPRPGWDAWGNEVEDEREQAPPDVAIKPEPADAEVKPEPIDDAFAIPECLRRAPKEGGR